MASFQETLKKLISRNIVITKTKSGKLKTIDFNKSQSTGSPTQYQNRPKWKISRGYSTTSGYGSGFTNEEIEALRKQMYQDYDIMDTDAIVSSVIDIYSDECLGQDTIIPLLDGRKMTIKQLFELNETNFWLYGLDQLGNFKPSKAERVVYKGFQKCAKITLDDKTVIKCTLDHLWVIDGINCILTKDLKIGDSIYALKTKLSSELGLNNYEMISDNENNFNYVHRLVARSYNIENYECKKSYLRPVIHHKSFNKYNNNPEELCWMEATDHIKLHSSLNDLMWQRRYADSEFMEKFRRNIGEKNKIHWQNKSPEFMNNWSKQKSEFMINHMSMLTESQRKERYGLPGEKNGRWQKGYLTKGEKNGRWIHDKVRADDINLIEAMFIVAQEYKFVTDNLKNIFKKYYDFATNKEYLKLVAEICYLCRLDSIKKFPFYYFKLKNPNFIKELREQGFKTGKELIKYCKNKDIQIGFVQRILKEHHYNSIPDFVNSKNHRIINIEYCDDHVYDIVNVEDNHLFAIETLDGSKLYTHNCSTNSEQGELLIIKTNDERIKKILHNLFYDIMNIDFNLWPWIRTSCKYGDNFLYLQIAEGVGVVNVMPIHPLLIIREEGINGDPQSIRFRYEGEYGQGWSPNHYFEETEIAHFRLLSDVNFLPYGRSVIEGGRKDYKRMCLPGYVKIWSPNGFKTIDSIKPNDVVFSYDINNNIYFKSSVKHWICNGKREVFEIRLPNRRFYGTADHLYLTTNGYKQISDLTTNDYIILSDLSNLNTNSNNIPNLILDNVKIVSNFDFEYFDEFVKPCAKKCLICGQNFKHLNSLHLKHKHNILYSEYNDLIGNSNYFNLMNRNVKIDYQDAIQFCDAYGLDKSKLKRYIPNSTVEIVDSEKLIENFAMFVRFFGFILGDGWIDENSLNFSLGTRLDKSQKYVDFIDKIGCNFKIIYQNTSRAECNVNNSYFVRLLKQLEFLTGTKNKIIPSWIYDLDNATKLEFLLGFADADGCDISVNKNQTKFALSGINKGLLEGLHTIAQQIGLDTTSIIINVGKDKKWSNGKIYKSNDCYTFGFNLNANHKTLIKNGVKCQKIISIWSIGEDEVYDIEVDNDFHNFVVDGVISHNCLMEDSMMLNRIMRAPERRLFKIDIGNIAPEEVDAYIEEISNSMKKTPYIDPTTGDFNLRYNILNSQEDFFLPVRGSDSGTTIETLPGLQNDKMLDDVEYFKNKMISAFKVPKDYLGYGGEEQGGSGGKAQLASIDIRFARTIERVQKIFVSEFYKIALIHLISQGFEGEDLLNFELSLTNPSLVFERQKTDVMTARVDLAKSAREENPLLSDIYIYKNLWGFTDEEIEMLKLQKIEDAKYQFRLKQIIEEGNDPEVTGKSFGTPHDIATMQVASKFMPGQYGETNKSLYTKDERENNDGKPDQHKSSFETRRDQDFGDDPVGRKDMNKMENLIKKYAKFKPKSKAEPQMLSEENLLKIEDNYN